MVDNDQQPPSMDRPTFVNLARRWLQEGKARCSAWSGTITQTIDQTGPMMSKTTIQVTVKDGDAIAAVHMTGHRQTTGQGCSMRDDTFTADTDGDLADLTILVNRDLLSVPGFQAPPLPAVPPGMPAPPNLGDNNGYSFVLRIPAVQGNDHWEQVNTPPSCVRTSGNTPFTLTPAGGVVNKMIDPRTPDHLSDNDVQQQPGAIITTEWDLTRE